jgi:hypothetical protein
MRKKSLKAAALAALGGMMFQFGGGCLGDSWWGRIAMDGLMDIGWEVLLDYDAVYDLWAD